MVRLPIQVSFAFVLSGAVTDFAFRNPGSFGIRITLFIPAPEVAFLGSPPCSTLKRWFGPGRRLRAALLRGGGRLPASFFI